MTPHLAGLIAAAILLWVGVFLDVPFLPGILFGYAAYAIIRGRWSRG